VVFDFGVNSGPSRAIKFAQGVVSVTEDGILGPLTLKAINAVDPSKFVIALCNARLAFMRGLTTWRVFGSGWSSRVADLQAYSLKLASPPVGLIASVDQEELGPPHPLAFAKAYHPDDIITA
jgi:lysozyme family protein